MIEGKKAREKRKRKRIQRDRILDENACLVKCVRVEVVEGDLEVVELWSQGQVRKGHRLTGQIQA